MAAVDLSRVMATVSDHTVNLRLRILGDADEGRLHTSGRGLDMSHVPQNERVAYFDVFRGMCCDSWLMEAAPDSDGSRRIILTSIGEFVHRHANTDRYQSRHTFEVRDGKVHAQAVTR